MLMVVLAALLLGGGGLMVYAFRNSSHGGAATVAARLGRYGLAGPSATPVEPGAGGRSGAGKAATKVADRIATRSGKAQAIQAKLEQADLKATAGEWLTICAGVVLVAALAGFLFKGIIGFLGLALIALVAPWFYLRRRTAKRKREFIGQLSDMAQMMGNSMRAGFSIIQSMELIGNEAPKPASHEFERVVTEIKLGLPVDQALDHLLRRMPSEDLELMVVAVNVQRQIGGNLSEILAVISNTIRERVRFERDLKALTAQARYSSYIITALPVGVAIVINLMDPTYESYLYKAMLGHVMIGMALCMLGLGFFFLNKIANIEV